MTVKREAIECCMCGDFGVSSQLFQCNLCKLRSQHRYCSNLYPKAETYEVCNWCLISQKENPTKSQNSSSSSKSEILVGDQCKKKKINGLVIKKQRSLDRSSISPVAVPARRRIITTGALEEKIRRTKSEEISNNKKINVTKYIVKNKARRYKFLDEVSC